MVTGLSEQSANPTSLHDKTAMTGLRTPSFVILTKGRRIFGYLIIVVVWKLVAVRTLRLFRRGLFW